MSILHYEIWKSTPDGTLSEIVASGSPTLSATRSDPVAIPKADGNYRTVVILKVVGTDRAYVEWRTSGASAQATGHLAADANPRVMLDANDGAPLFPVPSGGSFTHVLAAAV